MICYKIIQARYIKVKVEHYLLFMFSPPKICWAVSGIKYICLHLIHVFYLIQPSSKQIICFDFRKQNSVLPIVFYVPWIQGPWNLSFVNVPYDEIIAILGRISQTHDVEMLCVGFCVYVSERDRESEKVCCMCVCVLNKVIGLESQTAFRIHAKLIHLWVMMTTICDLLYRRWNSFSFLYL